MKNNEELLELRDRAMALSPVYWNPVAQTSDICEKIYGIKLNKEYNIFAKGRMRSIMIKKEWDKAANFIAHKFLNDQQYFNNIINEALRAKNAILDYIKDRNTDFSCEDSKQLIAAALQIRDLFINYDTASVYSWFLAGDYYKDLLREKLNIKIEELNIITTPSQETLATQMEEEILRNSLLDDIAASAAILAKKYYWLPFGYDGPDVWNEYYFKNRIITERKNIAELKSKIFNAENRAIELSQLSEKIIRQHGFGQEEKRLLEVMKAIVILTDERKMLDFQLFYLYDRVLVELGQRYDLSRLQMKYLFTHELEYLDKQRDYLRTLADDRLGNDFMTVTTNGKLLIASKELLENIKERTELTIAEDIIRGQVACRGISTTYHARVKILVSPSDCSKIQKGEILVAAMTSPDYVTAMNLALGFITDEGGVTCHAAIIAREMKKPCIIGTKIATKFLKDNDLVEIDTGTGIIRKI